MRTRLWWLAASPWLLAACASVPTAPRVTVLPGSGKTWSAFQRDDLMCRDAAYAAAGGARAQQSANDAAVGSAVAGTAIGAAVGGLINGGHGAAAGAGIGLLTGAAIGSNQAQAGGWDAQTRYDRVYVQCMYAQGNQVPGRYVARRQAPNAYAYPPPPPRYAPPPASAYSPPDAAIPPPNAPPPR